MPAAAYRPARLSSGSAGLAPRRRPGPLAVWNLVRQRHALAALDARLLADVGIDADAAAQESARPAWDLPSHWRR